MPPSPPSSGGGFHKASEHALMPALNVDRALFASSISSKSGSSPHVRGTRGRGRCGHPTILVWQEMRQPSDRRKVIEGGKLQRRLLTDNWPTGWPPRAAAPSAAAAALAVAVPALGPVSGCAELLGTDSAQPPQAKAAPEHLEADARRDPDE
jgi:hypothetical protein